MVHFYTIAEAIELFPKFMNNVRLSSAKSLWLELRGKPPRKIKLLKKGRRMDFRRSECHSINKTWRNGLNYLRRRSKLPQLSVGLSVCLHESCKYKSILTANKRNARFICSKCKSRQHHGFAAGYVLEA